MKLSTFILTLKTNSRVNQSPSILRGFFAQKYPQYELLHQHNGDKKLIYSYPKVQYKIINSNPMILGIGEAVEVVKQISNIDHLDLKEKKYNVTEKRMIEKNVNFGVTKDIISYKFLTPWLALNEESYSRYKKRNKTEKRKQLESIIVGNILSMSKGLEYVITDELKAKIVDLKKIKTSLKNIPMLGFLGTFSVNFEIPDYWGIGKSVSRGFGTIERVKELRVGELGS